MAYQDWSGGPRIEPSFDAPIPRGPSPDPQPLAASGRRGGSRAKLAGAVVALAAVAGFTGIAWHATNQGQRNPAAVVPLIRADKSPVKVLPEEPGGMDVPNRDKLIYMQIDPNAKEPTVERLLPPPEPPMDKPAPPPESAKAPPAGPLIPEVPDVAPAPAAPALPEAWTAAEMDASEPDPPAVRSEPEEVAEAAASEPEEKAVTSPEAEAEAAAPEAPVPSPAEVPAAQPAAPDPERGAEVAAIPESAAPAPEVVLPKEKERQAMAAAAAAAAEPPAAERAVAAGGYRVQLGALREEARADREAARLSRAHREILGDLAIASVRADLGSRGVFYRLRAGPLADRDAAEALCRAFAARRVNCLVIAP